MGDNCEGSGDMEVEIADQMEDPPWELIPVIEEDSDDIPILRESGSNSSSTTMHQEH